jgi:cytochrome c553
MRIIIQLATLAMTMASMVNASLAQDITYRKNIRALWEQKCNSCHGRNSPYLGEFNENKEKFTKLMAGPRMDTYADLVAYVGWPDTGALMRRLDDGKNTANNRPGNMYVYLGGDEAERQKNLALFKAWVGDGGWFLGRVKDLDKTSLEKMKVAE